MLAAAGSINQDTSLTGMFDNRDDVFYLTFGDPSLGSAAAAFDTTPGCVYQYSFSDPVLGFSGARLPRERRPGWRRAAADDAPRPRAQRRRRAAT